MPAKLLVELLVHIETIESALDEYSGFCRVCGCTEDSPCEGGCSWVADTRKPQDPAGLPPLCSACIAEDQDEDAATKALVRVTDHTHTYTDQGVRYVIDEMPRPGTSAKRVALPGSEPATREEAAIILPPTRPGGAW